MSETSTAWLPRAEIFFQQEALKNYFKWMLSISAGTQAPRRIEKPEGEEISALRILFNEFKDSSCLSGERPCFVKSKGGNKPLSDYLDELLEKGLLKLGTVSGSENDYNRVRPSFQTVTLRCYFAKEYPVAMFYEYRGQSVVGDFNAAYHGLSRHEICSGVDNNWAIKEYFVRKKGWTLRTR